MAYDKQGKASKVKDRWYGDHKYRHGLDLKPCVLVGKPQFTINDLYISPFIHRRRYSEDGHMTYVPLERNLQPTGINVMDEFLRYLSQGQSDIAAFCKRNGTRVGDIDSLIFLLTDMRGVDFRQAYQMRMCATSPCPSPMSPTVVASARTPISISPTSATSSALQQIGVNNCRSKGMRICIKWNKP